MRSTVDMRTKESGFSLLEVLVAFVILSLVATALFRLFGGALGNAAAASDWSRALLVAQTRLAVAANTLPLREHADQGTEIDGRIRWETKVAPYTPCGWGRTLLEALEECVRAVNRFPYQG